MPSDEKKEAINDGVFRLASEEDGRSARDQSGVASSVDSAARPAHAAGGRVGAAPIKWGWWAVGLAVSVGLWWVIAQALG